MYPYSNGIGLACQITVTILGEGCFKHQTKTCFVTDMPLLSLTFNSLLRRAGVEGDPFVYNNIDEQRIKFVYTGSWYDKNADVGCFTEITFQSNT